MLAELIAAAVAGSLSAACGGSLSDRSDAGGISGGADATSGDATAAAALDAGLDGVSCVPDAGSASRTLSNSPDAAAEASVLWSTIYGVDPTCCQPQLWIVDALGTQGGGPNPNGACDFAVAMPCPPQAQPADAAPACAAWCAALAPAGSKGLYFGCCQTTELDGGLFVADCNCGSGCGLGRPPRGFVPLAVRCATPVGAELARGAQLEAASASAFLQLRADLARHGAHASLLRDISRAARDEVRHARRARREAERHGATVPAVRVPATRPRTLERLALDNAREGCVVETFGAALLVMQSARAADPALRSMFAQFARDELRHAKLSWRIDAWLTARLDAASSRRVRDARRDALRTLGRELGHANGTAEALGVPDRDTRLRLLAALQRSIHDGRTTTDSWRADACPSCRAPRAWPWPAAQRGVHRTMHGAPNR